MHASCKGTHATSCEPRLPQLDVVELWVGVDVGVGNADQLPPALRSRVRVGRVQRLQHHNQRHIVLHTRTQTNVTPTSFVPRRPLPAPVECNFQ